MTDLRLWPADISAQPAESTTRQANDLIDDAFGPGANGPFLIAVDLDAVPAGELGDLRAELAAVPGVAGVAEPVVSPTGGAAVLVLEPTTAPADEATTELLAHLRADVLPDGVHVTGATPVLADITALLDERIWLVIGFVVGVSVLLLTLAFRSPVVALKAAVMNLLSIGAAYGVMVAVFSWGWGRQLFGLDQRVPISSWVPILMFAVAFGLSMDYEVFLLGRVREEWQRTGDPHRSVVARARRHRPADHRGRRDHGRRLHRLRDRGRPRAQADRRRSGRRDPRRRDRRPDGPGPGHHGPARPLELVAAPLAGPPPAAPGPRAARAARSTPLPSTSPRRRARPRRHPPTPHPCAPQEENRDDHHHRHPVPQVLLPGQAAAPEGPVDMIMMYVMHHAFRRDLAAFAAAVPATPVEDARDLAGAGRSGGPRFAEVLHKHHSGEDAGLWPLLLERVDAAGDARPGDAGGDGGRARARSTRCWRRAPAASPGWRAGGDGRRPGRARRPDGGGAGLPRPAPAHEEIRGDGAAAAAPDPGRLGGVRAGATSPSRRRLPRSPSSVPWVCLDLPADARRAGLRRRRAAAFRVVWLLTRRRFARGSGGHSGADAGATSEAVPVPLVAQPLRDRRDLPCPGTGERRSACRRAVPVSPAAAAASARKASTGPSGAPVPPTHSPPEYGAARA